MKTYQEIRSQLSDIEPSESTYRQLTPEDVLHLQQVMQNDEPWLAARAVFALSRIATPQAHNLVVEATKDQRSEVRIAAAVSSPMLPPQVSDTVLGTLLQDQDLGVRKFAVQAVVPASSIRVKEQVRHIARLDNDSFIKSLAIDKLPEL